MITDEEKAYALEGEFSTMEAVLFAEKAYKGPSFKYMLRRADGVLLAKSTSKGRAFRTAEAMFDNLTIYKNAGTKIWSLFDGKTLKATIQ